MTSIQEHIQQSSLGTRVTLVELDLTQWGEDTFCWVLGSEGDTVHTVSFNEQTYTPFPFQLEGFERSSTGKLPRPTLAISNMSGIFTPLVAAYDDLIGAPFKRIITFDRFLDGGPDEDPDAHLPIDVYQINKKLKDRGPELQWELASPMDVQGLMLPGRQVVRDYCDHEYRVWDPETETFNYDNATCPYVGQSGSFDVIENDALPANDRCGKRLGSCRRRFGENAELPYRGFPGVARIPRR